MATVTTAPTKMSMEDLEVSTSDNFEMYEDDGPHGGRVIVVESALNKNIMSFESFDDKAQEIRECLQLHSESCSGTVDLWELRQLAISRGGLLCPSLRQVAWPLLAGVSVSSLEEANTKTASMDDKMVDSMQDDIEKTVWNLEELVRQSQTGKDSFWYASLLSPTPGSSSTLETDAPSLAPLASPCSSSVTSHSESQSSTNSPLQKTKPSGGPTHQDQILLIKVLTQALEGQTEYPVAGLSNLAALCMINLESTSLSSLLLAQLATYPLKAAFSGAASDSTPYMQAMMECLLQEFQPKAQVDIQSKSEEALVWFSGDQSSNLQAASRLIDSFLVSHPLFPLYFGVASVQAPGSWNMEKVEELISKALEYMEQLPPAQLVKTVNASAVLPATPSWAIAATVTADWAPIHNGGIAGQPFTPEKKNNCQQAEPFSDEDSSSEWERLSTASPNKSDDAPLHDDNSVQSAPTKVTLFQESYPLAMTAAGLGLPSTTTRSRALNLPTASEEPIKAQKMEPTTNADQVGKGVPANHRYWKIVFLLSAILGVLAVGWSQPYTVGAPTIAVAKTPGPSPAPHPFVERVAAPTGAVPVARQRPYKEKFLGLIPVDRPAPKKVLRTMAPPQRMVSTKPRVTKKTEEEKVKPAQQKTPKKVLVPRFPFMGTSKPVKAPSIVPPVEEEVEVPSAPPKAPESWSPSPQPVLPQQSVEQESAMETPSMKFQPLRPIKQQLTKIGHQARKLWSKAAAFVRRRFGSKQPKQ